MILCQVFSRERLEPSVTGPGQAKKVYVFPVWQASDSSALAYRILLGVIEKAKGGLCSSAGRLVPRMRPECFCSRAAAVLRRNRHARYACGERKCRGRSSAVDLRWGHRPPRELAVPLCQSGCAARTEGQRTWGISFLIPTPTQKSFGVQPPVTHV